MDPKHQFAAQYVLSRAAAERRERDTLIAAAAAAGGSGLLSIGGQNSMCASPSAHSDSSSGNGRLSSTGSDAGTGLLNANNNNNNSNCNNNNNSGCKPLGDGLRGSAAHNNNGHLHNQYEVEDLHANRMAVMAAAAGIVGQTGNAVGGALCSPNDSSAAVQAAVVNLAAAMRMSQQQQQQNQSQSHVQSAGSVAQTPAQQQQSQQQQARPQQSLNNGISHPGPTNSPADSMRSSLGGDPMAHHHQQQQHHHHAHHQQQSSPEAALRIHQAEAILRSQAEAALRLAVSQAAAVVASNNCNDVTANPLRHHNGSYSQPPNGLSLQNQNGPHQTPAAPPSQSQQQNQQNVQQQQPSQVSPELSEALRLQEQRLEQALRLHGGDPRALGFPLNHQPHPAAQHHNP